MDLDGAKNVSLIATAIAKQTNPYYRGCASYTQRGDSMTKLMTETVILKVDPETKSKLESLAKDSDKSKVIRSLILREWDTQNDSIRVPIVGKIGERK